MFKNSDYIFFLGKVYKFVKIKKVYDFFKVFANKILVVNMLAFKFNLEIQKIIFFYQNL